MAAAGAPVINPNQQFSDANGIPYAGGTITTYVRGTTTPKATWGDPELTALNTNPVVLSAAGTCIMWGTGDYQLQLNDAAGNLIWSVPSTAFVSSAMLPVTTAPTIADALNVLGVNTAISTAVAAEASTRSTADASLTTAINATDAALQTETDSRIQNDDLEIAARTNADTNLQAQINTLTGGTPTFFIQGGVSALVGATGLKHVTFAPAFATACTSVQVTTADTGSNGAGPLNWIAMNLTTTGCDVVCYVGTAGLTNPQAFNWIALGH